jgi:PPOX class probable F420-dependent enzyme
MPKRLSRPEWERFLKGRHVAVLGTVGPGGEPVLTPIWYFFRDGKILMRTGKDSAKAKNIAKDARATVCVQNERAPYRSVTVYGRATIGPAEARLGATMARRYLGAIAGAAYMRVAAEQVEQGAEITLIMTPERALTQDFSAETPMVGRIWLIAKRLLPAAALATTPHSPAGVPIYKVKLLAAWAAYWSRTSRRSTLEFGVNRDDG